MASSFLLNAFLSARLRSNRLTDEADVEKSYRGKYREILEERVRREQKIKAEFYDRLLIIAFLSANVGLVCYSPSSLSSNFSNAFESEIGEGCGRGSLPTRPHGYRGLTWKNDAYPRSMMVTIYRGEDHVSSP
jgi:hypothetical protein